MGVLGEMFPGRKLRSEAGEDGSGQGFRLGPVDLDAGVVEVYRAEVPRVEVPRVEVPRVEGVDGPAAGSAAPAVPHVDAGPDADGTVAAR